MALSTVPTTNQKGACSSSSPLSEKFSVVSKELKAASSPIETNFSKISDKQQEQSSVPQKVINPDTVSCCSHSACSSGK